MLWPVLLCGACSLVVILRLLDSYGDRKRCAWYVQVAAVVSWYLPFTIVFILPFDFSSTLYRKCSHDCEAPVGYIGSDVTRRLWVGLYWFMYMLTWVVLPIMMSYVDSGAFTFRDRLRESAWSNVQFYGVSGAVGLVVVGYIAVSRGVFGADLVGFLMALANFWGLFLVITMMGFGLVSIPRKLWRRGDLEVELTKIENRAMAYKDSAYDSWLEVVEVVGEAQLAAARIGGTSELRTCIDQVLGHCGAAAERMREAQPSPPPQTAHLAGRVPGDISAAYLAGLHNRVKRAVLREERDRWRWSRAARRAFFLQDAIASRANPLRQLESSLRPWSRWSVARRSAAWWWFVAARPVVYRALAAGAAALSATVLWSELTFNVDASHLSAVHHLLRSVGLSYFGIEATSIVVIAYMCLCAYSSVMKLRIFNVYSLEPHHHTNERSLLFCGAYLCRLMFPLCYNFLSMAGSSDETTEFARFMDQIDLVPILGEQSTRVIPVLIMIPAAMAFFNVHGRAMEYFGSGDRSGGDDGRDGDDDEDTELGPLCLPREEGRGLLVEARRVAERQQGVAEERAASEALAAPAASVAPSSASTRRPRGWHLGRPSLDRLQDDPSPAADHDPPADRVSSDSDSASHDGAGPPSSSPSAPRPSGMAARFGRWMPPHPPPPRSASSTSLAAKARASRPSAQRLRPSSRQSSARFNYASDDGPAATMRSPPAARAAARLLMAPSSPARLPNPWADPPADPRPPARRHAQSEGSARNPRSTTPTQ
ncbi:hypothetical protein GGI04_001006 [Coemansia thaxteri]|nr:hypothetical protein GGI04_001006 [Coemansia thaxteri]KAJ2472903.1 hypothetical protein GGI02_001258 [Coemansia sp. RSA 2322]